MHTYPQKNNEQPFFLLYFILNGVYAMRIVIDNIQKWAHNIDIRMTMQKDDVVRAFTFQFRVISAYFCS